MTEPTEPQATGPRGRARDVAVRVAGIGAVAAVLWLLFTRLVSWSEVTAAVSRLTSRDWMLLVVVSGIRLAVEPLLLMAATPQLRWPRALPGYLAPTAAAVVVPGPSDLVARYAMFRSWGYSGAQTGASVVLVLLYTTFAKVALPLVAAAVLVAFDSSVAQVGTVAMIAAGRLLGGVIVLALLLRSDATARRLGHAAGTAARRVALVFRVSSPETLAADLAERAALFRDQTGDVVRARTHLAAAAAFAGQAALFAILLVSVRGVGIGSQQLDGVTLFAAFALVQLVTTIPVTPSGLGVAEAAYVVLLTADRSVELAGPVAAAALIYRVFSWLVIVPLGALAWSWWRWGRAPPPTVEG
jgi:uncharacterized membrane protein YbhN (UPF0104 family)